MKINNISISIIPNAFKVVCSKCGRELSVKMLNDGVIGVESCEECIIFDRKENDDIDIQEFIEPGCPAAAYACCPTTLGYVEGEPYSFAYDLILESYEDKVITLKTLRDNISGLSVKDAVHIINHLPCVIFQGIGWYEFNHYKKIFEDIGCDVSRYL